MKSPMPDAHTIRQVSNQYLGSPTYYLGGGAKREISTTWKTLEPGNAQKTKLQRGLVFIKKHNVTKPEQAPR